MPVRPYLDHLPMIHPTAWIAPGAEVIGDVELGAKTSIWFGTVVRGDVHHIRLGARVNVRSLMTPYL